MSNRKLLLADDSVTIQKVVNLTFAEEGIDVITVGDGDSALARISEEWPDLILADVNMPGANGYQICESIRSNKATEDIPVVLLVGSFEPFDEAEATRVGANAYLTKPFHSIRQLVSQVTELMDARRDAVVPTADDPIEELVSTPVDPNPSDDIESLYDQSFESQPEADDQIGSFDLSDQGLDDEMIETSFSSEAETVEFNVVEPILEPSAAAPSSDEFTALEVETPYSEPEPTMVESDTFLEDSAASTHLAQASDAEETESLFDNSSFESKEADLTREAYPGSQDQLTEEFAVGTEPEHSQSEAFVEPEQPPPAWNETTSDPFSETVDRYERASGITYENQSEAYHTYADEPFSHEHPSLSAPTSTRVFEEIDLLELPPVGKEATIEMTTVELAEEHSSGKQIVSVSPELIDIIVQKVIDRMSERS